MIGMATTVGCTEVSEEEIASENGGETSAKPTEIIIDGSSTVEPISTRVAEAYRDVDSSVQVSVATSGTGGGFKRFIAGETDINDASRPIKDSEAEALTEKGIGFVELKVAIDGLSVVVNKDNDFCSAPDSRSAEGNLGAGQQDHNMERCEPGVAGRKDCFVWPGY